MEPPIHSDLSEKEDIEKNKAMGILAYIIFFVPLLAARESKFAMYHANQGLLLFLSAVAVNIVGGILPFIGWFLIIPFGNLLVFIFVIIGIVNAVNGQKKPLPWIGSIQLFK